MLPQINLQILIEQIMIRRLQILPIFSQLSKQYAFSGIKVLRDDDQLSQTQIDSILGLDEVEKQKPKPQTKQMQPVAKEEQEKQVGKVRQLFYNLIPKVNQNFPICVDPNEIIIEQTPTQNIFAALGLVKTCSYDEYSQALTKFRTETDLYGDEWQKSEIALEDLQFKALLKYDSPYIEKARERSLVNISIPGSIQVEDPRNFMQLRPIEQFRHTPLIPISQQAMKKHQQMLEDYHRRQFIFEIKNQTIVNFFLVGSAMGICAYLIYLIFQKEEERTVAYSRLKFNRTMGEESQVKFKI